MRRVPAMVVAGVALFLAAACGGDDGDGDGDGTGTPTPPAATTPAGDGDGSGGSASTEEVCAAGEELFTELDDEGTAVRDALSDAAESGDPAELEQAQSDYLDFVGGFVEEARAIGASAEDPEVGAAVVTFADEFEAVAAQVAENPQEMDNVDTSDLQTATVELGAYCE